LSNKHKNDKVILFEWWWWQL